MKNLRKEVIYIALLLLAILAILPFASSQYALTANETSKINIAKNWLTNQTKTQWPSSTDENSLVLLALADDANSASKGRDALLAKSTNSECWPVQSGGCSIKSTAMALLALDAFGEDTSTIQSWLVARKKSFAEGVSWYMQLDTSENAKCKISYDGKNYNVSVGKDKKVSSSAGTCLSLAQNNYWLKVSSGSCLDKTFTVNCDKDFKVSFIYTKNSVLYVSSQIFDGASGQSVDAAIKSYCLGFTSCDYEGTLWAAYALQQAGNNYFSMLLPYLAGQSDLDVNAKYLPNTFLFALTSSTNYGEQVLQSQYTEGNWQAPGSTYGGIYDTALVLLMLSSSTAGEYGNLSSALNYVFTVQKAEGNWQTANSVRDTAFMVYAIAHPLPASIGGGGIEEKTECENMAGSCKSSCDANENQLTYACEGSDVCCEFKTCIELQGQVCGFDQLCSGASQQSKDGLCCIGTCSEKPKSCSELNGVMCEQNEKCSGNFEPATDTNYCCVNGECKKAGLWWLWLIIIAAIAVVAYWQRDKLKKFFGKRPPRTGQYPGQYPARPIYPPVPPRLPQRPIPIRPIYATQTQPRPRPLPLSRIQAPKPSSKKTAEEELQETLKKLRKLTK